MPSLLSRLSRLTMAQVPTVPPPSEPAPPAPNGAQPRAPAPEGVTNVPIFSNAKALTFPLIVALVKGSWLALETVPIPWFATTWYPLTACLVLGLLITMLDIQAQKAPVTQSLLGIFVGILNSVVTYGAVLGIGAGIPSAQ